MSGAETTAPPINKNKIYSLNGDTITVEKNKIIDKIDKNTIDVLLKFGAIITITAKLNNINIILNLFRRHIDTAIIAIDTVEDNAPPRLIRVGRPAWTAIIPTVSITIAYKIFITSTRAKCKFLYAENWHDSIILTATTNRGIVSVAIFKGLLCQPAPIRRPWIVSISIKPEEYIILST
jgi:hypothetical protein